MYDLWDAKTDAVERGDLLREVTPIMGKTRVDENGFTHYVFSKRMFDNPHYSIPSDELKLFNKFVDGGSRQYPSDGSVPVDLVVSEARKILKDIVRISKNASSLFHKEALEAIKKGKLGLVRGTIKLYLGKYTTRDWRRKRFTDDIDFWVHQKNLMDSVLKKHGWVKNKNTREWEKNVFWLNPLSNEREAHVIIASNDTNLLLDFGGGSYLEGSSLRDIFKKKLKRGHNVDISDIINVAMIFNKADGHSTDAWYNAWEACVESANARSTRITSNMISLCRYSFAIANYLDKVGKVLFKYHDDIFDKNKNPDSRISKMCQNSIHWQKYLKRHKFDVTRELLHNYIFEQAFFKIYHANNLRNFAIKVLKLLNSKYEFAKVIFEIEEK